MFVSGRVIYIVHLTDLVVFTARQHSSSYAKRCISYDRFCLTVRHSPVSCQNDSSYDHAVFTGG